MRRGGGVETSRSKVFEYLKRIFNFKNLFTTHNSQFTKAIAFTLAETLIVMGIIGVVAALTLPNLNSSTGDREKVAKVKKIYQNLNDAFERAQAVYGPIEEWPLETGSGLILKKQNLGERLTEFMKISKNYNNYEEYILTDGTYVDIIPTDIGDSAAVSGAKYVGKIAIDIDGPNKGKSKEGVDIFFFDLTSNGIYPNRLPENDLTNLCFEQGYCTRWVVEKGNMDYLKADNSGKCKNNNSITLNWTTNTTCK